MKDLPSVRKDALELGETNYFTGKPCKRGHIEIRNAKTGRCLACQREDAKGRYSKTDYYKSLRWKNYQREYHRQYVLTPEGQAAKRRAYERWHAKRKAEEAEEAKSKKDSKSKR